MSVTRPRLGLALKIFAASVSLVAVVLLGAFVVASAKASRTAEAAIDRQLAANREAVQALLNARSRAGSEALQVITLVPAFREMLTRREPPHDDLVDQAEEHARTLGASYVMIVDRRGILQARSDDPSASGDTLRDRSSLVDFALDDQRTVTGIQTSADSLYQAVAVPIVEPASRVVHGVIIATYSINDSVARAIKRATGSDVVFWDVSQDTTGRYQAQVRAVTLLATPDWLPVLADSGMMARLESDTGGTRLDPAVGGVHYLGVAAPLRAAHGEIYGAYAVLRSREAELAAFTGLQRTLLLAGVVGLAVSLVASLGVARRIARPVRQLVEATRKVREGDYAAEIPQGGGDEIGELADAFRGMVEDLKEKQSLVDYMMAASSAGRTVPIAAMPDLSMTAVRSAAGTSAGGRVLAPGELFAGRYEVKSVLGAGGMGVVYCARDRELDELVAVKTLKPDAMAAGDGSTLERFKQEIRLARRITHRNVVRTHDLGDDGGMYYITMEFVEGTSLKELIVTRGRLPVSVTLTVGKQLARALEVAHEQGVIHRDIKPQNIVIEPSGFLKVMDFGIARLAERKQEGKGLTALGTVIGTPEYMAPEQLMGEEIDARADLYAAAAVLFECVTGETPFTAPTVTALMVKHIEG
ncbi:MAG: protein kinase domain-containing protein, partial [Gemmatimonadales bacterium]